MKFVIIAAMTIAGVGLTLVADIILKKGGWHDWRYLLWGFVLYALVAIPAAFAFKYSEFGSLVLAWESTLVIASVIAASWYFGEAFTPYRLIALILAVTAIFFAYK